MSSFHNCKGPISNKIRYLLTYLTTKPSEYDKITPKIVYWVEYVLRERFTTVDELVESISWMAWESGGSYSNIGRFFKEFYDAPHRSEQARSFVTQLCSRVLRWFAITSVEYHSMGSCSGGSIADGGGNGFIRAASFVGHPIEYGLLSQELVRQHLIKPLINHYDGDDAYIWDPVRANAIYQLFVTAGNTLFQGLLEAKDIQLGFEMLDAQNRAGKIVGYDAARVKELREIHTAWLQRKDEDEDEDEEEQRDSRKTQECQVGGDEETMAAELPAEAETPVAFATKDLPADIRLPSSILQDIKFPSVLHDVESSSETFVDIPAGTISSPTLSISTISDLTPTELGEEIEHKEEEEEEEEQTTTHHDTFYFEDGNVEIVCGHTLFRVHSTIISFSSSKLRDILSPLALLHAPTPEGRPQIIVSESAKDFGILLKMIYTPGFPARHEVPEFTIFASLLRMTTKYGFSDIRHQLIKDLKGAYPTRWEDFKTAKVLGEDIFGSPKPHPNAVLNLFEAQNVRFAIPFAAYRASVGGFSALMSDKPGTVLPRRTLATTIHGMHVIRSLGSRAWRATAYAGDLKKCPDKACVLNVSANSIEKWLEVLGKIYDSMVDGRKGDVLSPPSLDHLFCTKCVRSVGAVHTTLRSICWAKHAPAFAVSDSWDGL